MGLDEGVEGREGGTLKSCIRLVEFLCDLAFDATVGSSYRASFDCEGLTSTDIRGVCFWLDSMTDKDAFRVSFRTVEGGVGGLRPVWDF